MAETQSIEITTGQALVGLIGSQIKENAHKLMKRCLKQIVTFNDASPGCIVALDALVEVERLEKEYKELEKRAKKIDDQTPPKDKK